MKKVLYLLLLAVFILPYGCAKKHNKYKDMLHYPVQNPNGIYFDDDPDFAKNYKNYLKKISKEQQKPEKKNLQSLSNIKDIGDINDGRLIDDSYTGWNVDVIDSTPTKKPDQSYKQPQSNQMFKNKKDKKSAVKVVYGGNNAVNPYTTKEKVNNPLETNINNDSMMQKHVKSTKISDKSNAVMPKDIKPISSPPLEVDAQSAKVANKSNAVKPKDMSEASSTPLEVDAQSAKIANKSNAVKPKDMSEASSTPLEVDEQSAKIANKSNAVKPKDMSEASSTPLEVDEQSAKIANKSNETKPKGNKWAQNFKSDNRSDAGESSTQKTNNYDQNKNEQNIDSTVTENMIVPQKTESNKTVYPPLKKPI